MNRIARISIAGVVFAIATLCAGFAGILIPVYRRQFDMEMSYAEMLRHVRNAEIALLLFSLCAALALWQLVRAIRHRADVRPN